MTIVPNSQSFEPGASGVIISALEDQWKTQIDTVLLGLGREITLHLPPAQSPCPNSSCRFNSTYKKFISSDGTICRSCRGQGFLLEPRQTVYLANIRWTNEPLAQRNFEEQTVAGRLPVDLVRTKTVASSYDHILSSIGATIDGQDFELFEEPRFTGFVNTHYVVAFWKRVAR